MFENHPIQAREAFIALCKRQADRASFPAPQPGVAYLAINGEEWSSLAEQAKEELATFRLAVS